MEKDGIPLHLQGNSPCADCGTKENPVWFAESPFWNDVVEDQRHLILCLYCFIGRAEKKYKVVAWRILPDFKWETNTDL